MFAAPTQSERHLQLGFVLALSAGARYPTQLVVELIGAAQGVATVLPFHLLHGVGIEQVAQFLRPSSSRSRSRSRDSAWARRSAGGVSSSYMYVAM